MESTVALQASEESAIMRFARFIERVGNKIPHPMYLFLIISFVLILASYACSEMGVSVTFSAVNRSDGKLLERTVPVINMLSGKGVVGVVSGMWDNYKNMASVSLLLMLGMGLAVAEYTGFFSALIRKFLLSLPRWMIVYVLCLVGICANVAADAGMVLATSLGAIVYKSIGRNPWIGAITGYAAAAAGFTANLLPASVDAGLAIVTQQIIDAMALDYSVNMLSNYIFTVVSTVFLAGVVAWVSETFLPRLIGDYTERVADHSKLKEAETTPAENRGLLAAGLAALVMLALLLAATLPADSMFRNPDTGAIIPASPFMNSLVPFFFIAFIVLGCAYGIGVGAIKKSVDVPKLMIRGVNDMAPMLLTFFMVSIMLYIFNTSNLATVVSVAGERFLSGIGLTGLPLLLIFVLVIAFINLFMYSATSKWLLMAPVFVPMFANLGIHPAVTQLAYRIGDSCTNSLTPLNVCMIACIGIMNTHRDEKLNPEPAGVGTVISGVLPFCVGMQVGFMILFVIFYVFNLPIGF